MKKLTFSVAILSTLLLSGCSQRVVDFTLASTKNVELNNGNFVTGDRVVGEDTKAVIIVPVGVPSLKEASDQAIEKEKCAVALSNVTGDFEYFSFFFGYQKYVVEGDLVIDKSLPGCSDWSEK